MKTPEERGLELVEAGLQWLGLDERSRAMVLDLALNLRNPPTTIEEMGEWLQRRR